jgi:prepilin-type N-terminal cleavage/methylation domain-containing protein
MNAGTTNWARSAGFTLMELVIVMGILCGFLLMLVQFLDSGVQLFDEGETGQGLADRAETARFAVDRELRALRGPGVTVEQGKPAERLVSQLLPLGLPAKGAPGDPRGLLFRATVGLAPEQELRVVQDTTLLRAAVELGPAAVRTS